MSASKFVITFDPSASQEQIQKTKDDITSNGGTIHKVNPAQPPFPESIVVTVTPSAFSQLQSLQSGGLIENLEPDQTFTTQ